MFADIASGKVDTADWFFLFAVILATVAAILYAVGTRPVRERVNMAVWAPVALSLAVACASLAWLIL